MADISYQFTVQSGYAQTAAAIVSAVEQCKSKVKTKPGGEFSFKITPAFGYFRVKFLLYISESNGITTIRIKASGNDRKKLHFMAYDKFLNGLMAAGLDIPVVPGEPYIVTTMQIGGGVEQQFYSRQHMSVSGAIAGGLLFGDLGALVGAYGGGSTRGRTRTVISNRALFLLCYSNGMIEEREIRKGSKLYVEVMAKLGATPNIRKYNQL